MNRIKKEIKQDMPTSWRDLGDVRITDIDNGYDYILSGDLGCVFIQKRTIADMMGDDEEDRSDPTVEMQEQSDRLNAYEERYINSFAD